MHTESSFYRNGNNRVIAGVCSGIADKLVVDPVIIRLIFVFLAIFAGGGLLVYIILWIVMPERYNVPGISDTIPKDDGTTVSAPIEKHNASSGNTQLIIGLILIGLGGLFLVAAFIPRVHIHDLWPVALIILGFLLLRPVSKQ